MDSIALAGIGGVATTVVIMIGLFAFVIHKVNKS